MTYYPPKSVGLPKAAMIFFFVVLTITLFYSQKAQSEQDLLVAILEEENQPPAPVEESDLLEPVSLRENPTLEAVPEEKRQQSKPVLKKIEIKESKEGKIPKGGSFYVILKKTGMSPAEIDKLIRSVKRVHNISNVKSGTPYKISFLGNDFLELNYEVGAKHRVSVVKNKDRYLAEILPIDYEIKTVTKKGIIRDNLYNTVVRMGEKPYLVNKIASIFAWDINFFKDLRKGDTLKMVMEKKYRDGKFASYGRFLGVEFNNQGRKITAIYFPRKKNYFTPQGKSMKKQFLKAPLKYSRISSGFSRKRLHPILKRRVPHLSIDYVAPIGTPVYAIADGKVSFTGRQGPSGKLIRIKHDGAYDSAYCHLAGFAKGIKKGRYVKQGQLIGTVGVTGRTTGPHLCFHLKKNGKPVNPLKLKSVRARPVNKKEWKDFIRVREDVLKKLVALERRPTITPVKKI